MIYHYCSILILASNIDPQSLGILPHYPGSSGTHKMFRPTFAGVEDKRNNPRNNLLCLWSYWSTRDCQDFQRGLLSLLMYVKSWPKWISTLIGQFHTQVQLLSSIKYPYPKLGLAPAPPVHVYPIVFLVFVLFPLFHFSLSTLSIVDQLEMIRTTRQTHKTYILCPAFSAYVHDGCHGALSSWKVPAYSGEPGICVEIQRCSWRQLISKWVVYIKVSADINSMVPAYGHCCSLLHEFLRTSLGLG